MIMLLTFCHYYLISFSAVCLMVIFNLQRESLLRHQEQEQLTKEQSRIASLMSEKQELEEKLNSMSREAAGSAHKNFSIFYIKFVMAY